MMWVIVAAGVALAACALYIMLAFREASRSGVRQAAESSLLRAALASKASKATALPATALTVHKAPPARLPRLNPIKSIDELYSRLRVLAAGAPVFRRDAHRQGPTASLANSRWLSLLGAENVHPKLLGSTRLHPTDVVAVFTDDSSRPLHGVAEESHVLSLLFKSHLLPLTPSEESGVTTDDVMSALSTYVPKSLLVSSHSSATQVAATLETLPPGQRLRLLFLNTCNSEDAAKAALASGKVDHVLAWSTDLHDAAAASFSIMMYSNLEASGWADVPAAFHTTLGQLSNSFSLLDPAATSDAAGVPVLMSASAHYDDANSDAVAVQANAVDAPPAAVVKVEVSPGVWSRMGNPSFADIKLRTGSDAVCWTDADGDTIRVHDDATLADAVAESVGALKLRLLSAPVATPTPAVMPYDSVVSVDMVVRDAFGGQRLVRCGSGVCVSSDLVVTNHHVVAPLMENDAATGVIGTISDWNTALSWEWGFEVVATDAEKDLALVRATRSVCVEANGWKGTTALRTTMVDGDAKAPALPALALGDADSLTPTSGLTVLGFPGLGGNTLTVNQCTLAGVTTDGFLKFTGALNCGGSGGALCDANGKLVGVPAHSPRLPVAHTIRQLEDGQWKPIRVDFDPTTQPLNHAIPVAAVVKAFGHHLSP